MKCLSGLKHWLSFYNQSQKLSERSTTISGLASWTFVRVLVLNAKKRLEVGLLLRLVVDTRKREPWCRPCVMIGASAERQLLTCRLETPVRTEDREEERVRRCQSGGESHKEDARQLLTCRLDTPVRRANVRRSGRGDAGENAKELHMATGFRNR